MNIYRSFLMALISTIATSCGFLQIENRKISEPLTMESVREKFPGYTLTEHNAGEGLYKVNCGNCHGLHESQSFTEASWSKAIPRMAVKVNKRAGRQLISESGEQAIFRYLYARGMNKDD
ncbi:MAG: Uncharacterised protein [Owenweeksia sp. TMED14]|nr:MAG: Uncharacterised protein [Owenweeksia sp. TMED14]